MIQPLIRAVCSTVALISTLISGKKHWNIILFLWAMAVLYFNRFTNYTSFAMVLIAISFKPERKKIYIPVYAIAVMVCLILYKDTYNHLIIHLIGCLAAYTIFSYINKVINHYRDIIKFLRDEIRILKQEPQEPLDITEEEAEILRQRCSGKEVKEIDLYSEDTIYRKLKNARIRNGCFNNSELITRYKKLLSK